MGTIVMRGKSLDLFYYLDRKYMIFRVNNKVKSKQRYPITTQH